MPRSWESTGLALKRVAGGVSDSAPHYASSPAAPASGPRTPPQRAPACLPHGRRIVVAVDHGGGAQRAVQYASKLLIRSPDDRVELVHVQGRGRPCGGPALPSPQHSRDASTDTMQRGGSAPWAELAPAGGSVGGGGLRPDWLKRLSLQAVPWQHSHGGRRDRSRSASPAGFGSQHESNEEEEGCGELLERCRQQLLASSRRLTPERVSVQLIPAGRTPEKAISKLCKEGRHADILVLGSREHGSEGAPAAMGRSNSRGRSRDSHGHSHGARHIVPGVGKLLSMVGTGEGVASYCKEQLRGTRVVCCGTGQD
ncbi:hypothetical protein ABPG77_008073 [Micractinium sp. CCAP 211/92]